MTLVGAQGSAYPYISNRATAPGRRYVQRDMSAIYHQTWGRAAQPVAAQVAPTASVLNDILTATLGPNNATITPALNGTLVAGGIATLMGAYGPYTGGRNVVITVTHATAVIAESGVITGIDINGRVIAEAWSVAAGGTTQTYTGKKAFKYVTSVSITSAGNATTDTNTVGDGVLFGLDVHATFSSTVGVAAGVAGLAVKEIMDTTLLTTGTVVPFDPVNSGWSTAFTADPRGTYSPATAPNGAHVYDLWFISDDPEYSDAVG